VAGKAPIGYHVSCWGLVATVMPSLGTVCAGEMRNLLTILAIICFVNCDAVGSGPYKDLEVAFKANTPLESHPINPRTILLVSNKHKGAYTYRDMVDIRLSSDVIEFAPSFPTMERVQISASSVSGCGETCFGTADWYADILIGSTGAEISIPKSQELIDWCWNNRLPIIPEKDRSDWLYKHAQLPDKATYSEQFSSRKEYDYLVKQSCLGF